MRSAAHERQAGTSSTTFDCLQDGSVKRLRVVAVRYQPEAAGHFHL